jgi:hypothetical protein
MIKFKKFNNKQPSNNIEHHVAELYQYYDMMKQDYVHTFNKKDTNKCIYFFS